MNLDEPLVDQLRFIAVPFTPRRNGPTQDEIRELAKEIQERWDGGTERLRRTGTSDFHPLEVTRITTPPRRNGRNPGDVDT